MQPIPTPISNVNVYVYTPGVPPSNVTPAIENASGTYSVGTLTTHVFYNMELHGGKVNFPVVKGQTYYALANNSDGKQFSIHWMYCLSDGENPKFGYTQSLALGEDSASASSMSDGQYIELGPITDISAVISFPPPQIGSMQVDLGNSGKLIGTRTGTPHLMGFRVDNPKAPHILARGQRGIAAKAVNDSGHVINYPNMTCEEANETVIILLQTFP